MRMIYKNLITKLSLTLAFSLMFCFCCFSSNVIENENDTNPLMYELSDTDNRKIAEMLDIAIDYIKSEYVYKHLYSEKVILTYMKPYEIADEKETMEIEDIFVDVSEPNIPKDKMIEYTKTIYDSYIKSKYNSFNDKKEHFINKYMKSEKFCKKVFEYFKYKYDLNVKYEKVGDNKYEVYAVFMEKASE